MVKEHIAREEQLRSMSVADYVTERQAMVQGQIRRLGISLSRTHPDHARFMAACLQAELGYLDVFHLRESRRGGCDQLHPDTVDGPWRRAKPAKRSDQAVDQPSSAAGAPSAAIIPAGRTLADCRAKWIGNRAMARKSVRPAYLREMDHTIAAFQSHSGLIDVGAIRRKHVLAFRDHISSTGSYKVQTVNKKVGFISSLLGTALNAGWVETPLGPDIYLQVPEDEDRREPYTDADLRIIFAHPVFTAAYRYTRVKACYELQFWLPLLACLHGMMSSEILQLGPDTVVRHPDANDVWCFEVTNAGDRRIKTLARRRHMPIRRELLRLGLLDIVNTAKHQGWRWLWTNMQAQDGDVTRVSGYFSSFWAHFARHELGITTEGSLYSFRHAFQDRLAAAGHGEATKQALMGHAEGGMTGRYGTKSKPRVANIVELDAALQALSWPFLSGVKPLS